MGLSSKPTDMDPKKEDNSKSSSDQTTPLSSKKSTLNAGLGPEKKVENLPDQFSFLIQCQKHEGWQTTSKSKSLQDSINMFSDLAINGSETGIRLIKVTLGPNNSQSQAEVVFKIEGEELVAASKGNFDLTRLGKSLLVDEQKKTEPAIAHDPHDLLAPVSSSNEDDNLLIPPISNIEQPSETNVSQSSNDDEEIGFPPLQAAPPKRAGKKTTITLISWASLFIGAAAVGVTLSDIPTNKIIEKVESFIPGFSDGYKSLIHNGDNQPKTVEAGTLGAKNARDILEELQGEYSPNLLQKAEPNSEAIDPTETNTPIGNTDELSDPLIAPPPVADLVLQNVDPITPEISKPLVDEEQMSQETALVQQEEIEISTEDAVLAEETSPAEIIRAPEKPEPPQEEITKIAENVSPEIAPTTKTLVLKDLTIGFTWSDTKESLGASVLNCLNITESIEGCRMDVESWLPDTRYVVGLFNREKGGKLIALQIDSQPFLTTSYALKSFDDATNAIIDKLPNHTDYLKEVEVAEEQKLFSILIDDKQARHYKHWSLVELGVPAYIHLSVKAIDQSSGFHRTIIAAVTE